MKRPFSVYCDWAYHDELGDSVELDEKMTMTALDALERWKRAHGFGFDYYLLDAFWFDPRGAYKEFKKTHWPRGFERARARMAELGMRPGLWYDVNSSLLDVAAWEKSVDAGDRCYSLSSGPYAKGLEEAWRHAIREWGVRLFKLDFANFWAAAKGSKEPPFEVYSKSIAALRQILRRLRDEYPDLAVIAYNGTERWGGFLGRPVGSPLADGFDLSWLDIFDYQYSGDPRPGDLPRTDLRRSIDIFQDHQVWLLWRCGFPLDRIDDHGCMVGDTNTIFYQGAHGLRRSYLATLARGGKRDIYYGDPTLPLPADVDFMRRARELFFGAFRSGLGAVPVGGEPGACPWHGFLTGGGARGLLYLVNGSFTAQEVSLHLSGLSRAEVLFRDSGPEVGVSVSRERLSVELAPEQMALVGLGEYARSELDLGVSDASRQPRSMGLLPLVMRDGPGGALSGEIGRRLSAREHLFVVAQAFNAADFSDSGPGLPLPRRFGGQTCAKGPRRQRPLTHEQVAISVEHGRKALEPAKLVPDVPVWAGISWVAKMYDAGSVAGRAPLAVRVRQELEPPRELVVRAYAVTY